MVDEQMALDDDDEAGGTATEEKYRLDLQVEIESNGPCRRHVRVKVPRKDIDHFREEALKEVGDSAAVPGFRVGHVPAQLVQRRFRKEIDGQVRQKVLLTSLEQLAEDNTLDPINEPDFDIESLDLPEEGDFEYEFDVEVRPDFELPNYTGLKIKRPVKEIESSDVDTYLEQLLIDRGTVAPSDAPAQPGDFVTATLEFSHDGRLVRRMNDQVLQLQPVLQFPDAELKDFDKLLTGATPGTVVNAKVEILPEAQSVEMRGEQVDLLITVSQVQRLHKQEANSEFAAMVGFDTIEELREQIQGTLARQVQYEQRQTTRRQVLERITESATWDLPETLVRKQVENALRREMLEMEQAGFSVAEIRARENAIRQRSVSSTRQALKEHFVLDKIATKENIEVLPHDIESEIRMMALQRGENPRKVRARLEKTGVIENLEAQIRERKAVDFILKSAVYEDEPMPPRVENKVHSVTTPICSALPQGAEGDEAG